MHQNCSLSFFTFQVNLTGHFLGDVLRKVAFQDLLRFLSCSYTVKVVATVFATPTGLTEGTVVASTATNWLYGRNNCLATPPTGWMGATVIMGATVATATNRLYGRNNSLATPPTGWMGATVITGATVVVTNWQHEQQLQEQQSLKHQPA
jgi:hypothetical protein